MEKNRLILYIFYVSYCKNIGNNNDIEKFLIEKLLVRKLYAALPIVIYKPLFICYKQKAVKSLSFVYGINISFC